MEQPGDPKLHVGSRLGFRGDQLVHHCEGVAVHVLVPVDRILLQPERRQLGEELVGELRLHRQIQTFGGAGRRHDLHELVLDALARNDSQPAPLRPHRLDEGPLRRHPELRHESRGPEHPERVVGERLLGGQRRA